ncbi:MULTISPECIES: sensor histidine kinase [Arenibacter]|uniref:sensor histidine kinase n=1 Tax=Arenibacter TaxID=178469 RepID=UPI001EFD84B8|nr:MULTISPECIES: HAMP domain-containing sensor histidine kinase [Arenibacter]
MIKKNIKIPLLKQASKTFFWASLLLMVISTFALYFYVSWLLKQEVEEELFSAEARIESALMAGKHPSSLAPIIEVVEVDHPQATFTKDTVIYDPSQNEMELFRELSTYKNINSKFYKISVRVLVVESNQILWAIILSYIVIIFLVFIFQFYLNKSYNKKLWYPFFHNLEQMKTFSLLSKKPIQFLDSEILEFSELNKEITLLTVKVKDDYENLKQYTEDVSHELQTPLAIIQAKIENIINDQTVTEVQFNQLTSIQKDIQRLTQLNKRLTLLTKLENQQFTHKENIDITAIIDQIIANFSEISSIALSLQKTNNIVVSMDPYLAEILCTNIISNAIKYNTNSEPITIVANEMAITVSNFGLKPIANPQHLFTRFYRETKEIKSTGLGLAIVKKICDLYGYHVSYKHVNDHHCFSIDFVTAPASNE